MSDKCKCQDAAGHARAVDRAIWMSLANAISQPGREEYWRAHADKLETKFTTDHGKHYSMFLTPPTSP
jgi:hypothetical protein